MRSSPFEQPREAESHWRPRATGSARPPPLHPAPTGREGPLVVPRELASRVTAARWSAVPDIEKKQQGRQTWTARKPTFPGLKEIGAEPQDPQFRWGRCAWAALSPGPGTAPAGAGEASERQREDAGGEGRSRSSGCGRAEKRALGHVWQPGRRGSGGAASGAQRPRRGRGVFSVPAQFSSSVTHCHAHSALASRGTCPGGPGAPAPP